MAKSADAISKTFIKEGGFSYSNKDTGGLTYLGLAYNKWPNVKIWPEVMKIIQSVKPTITIESLKNIGTAKGTQLSFTKDEESKINSLLSKFRKDIIAFYKKEFWDTLNADGIISQTFAESFFDFSVNSGSGTASILLQEYLKVDPDGDIGPMTLSKLNSELLFNTYNVHIDFTLIKIKKYAKICTKNSAQLANLHGWLNRTFEVFDEVFSIEVLINFKSKYPDSIPESLRPDIDRLLKIYDLNISYAANKTPTNLTNLHNKINEIIK